MCGKRLTGEEANTGDCLQVAKFLTYTLSFVNLYFIVQQNFKHKTKTRKVIGKKWI